MSDWKPQARTIFERELSGYRVNPQSPHRRRERGLIEFALNNMDQQDSDEFVNAFRDEYFSMQQKGTEDFIDRSRSLGYDQKYIDRYLRASESIEENNGFYKNKWGQLLREAGLLGDLKQ